MVDWTSFAGGGMIAALAALGVIMFFICVALYVYLALALMTIGKKMKYEYPWLAWIPFANISMILQMGGFHWALVFLLLIPILGWIALLVLMVIAYWRIFEALNYPGWLSLLMVAFVVPSVGWLGSVAFLVMLGVLAWGKPRK